MPLVEVTASGLHCERGGFTIDPWKPVPFALITHAHGDHARPDSERYLGAAPGKDVLARRVAADVETIPFGEVRRLGDVNVSFHPAGHVLGSAQIRIDDGNEVWVVSGDYKRAPDPTCRPWEVVPCDVFITEATFALPIYRWSPPRVVLEEIRSWWRGNAAAGKASILYCYILGKAQRLLAELRALGDLPEDVAYVHGALEPMNALYRDAGVALLETKKIADVERKDWAGQLILAPPSVRRSPWLRRFKDHEAALVSGWMQVRGTRRGRGLSRGFVLSDHADWPNLVRTIEESGAKKVLCTHGFSDTLARFLREERGLDASALATEFLGEEGAELARS